MKRYYGYNGILKNNSTLTIHKMFYSILCILSVFMCIISVFNDFFWNYSLDLDKLVAILSVTISIYLCYVYRSNIGLFIVMIFIAYSNYSVAVAVYLESQIRVQVLYDQFQNKSLSIAIICLLIFETCLLLFSKKILQNPNFIESKYGDFTKFENNDIISFGSILLYILMFFLTFNFGDNGLRGGGNAITEYRIVVAIIGCYYSGGKSHLKWLWSVLIVITSVMVFLSGNRADAIGPLIFIIMYLWPNFFTYKKILFALPFAIILMVVIGSVRGASMSSDSFKDAVDSLYSEKFTWDTAHYAYVPSVAIAELSNQVPMSQKVAMLFEHIIYIIVGSSFGFESNLVTFSANYYLHYNGCVSPVYFAFWFGYLGPMFLAYLVYIYISIYKYVKTANITGFIKKSGYILFIYFISNVARWYLYGPLALLRGAFVCFVVYGIVHFFDCLMRR